MTMCFLKVAECKCIKIIIIIFALLFLNSFNGFAQSGSIKGEVKEKDSRESIPVANIIIEGTNIGTTSDFDGKFEIKGLNAGTYNVQISFISYKTKLVENITVKAGQATEIIVELETESQLLGEVEVTAEIKRENENLLLMERQKATEIVQHIGAQELSRKGVGDVATAVTKICGISKVEGSNDIYVRGLGDRYNSTTLNRLPMPSNNPEQKNISLDIFTTEIVEYISIDKVFNNFFYGDFAGGNVDIVSKDFTGESFIKVDLGTNINTKAIDENIFPLKPGPGFFGFHTSQPPGTIAKFDFDYPTEPVYMSPIGISFNISGGNKHILGAHKDINYFVTAGFSNDFSTKEGIALSVNSVGYASKDLRMKSFSYNTNTTGMVNLGHRINRKNKINYNLLFINSSDNSTDKYQGTILDIADYDNGLLNRYTYEKNTVIINQILGNHEINNNTDLNWGISYNKTTSDVPDRLQNTFRMLETGQYVFGQNQITDNHRYYHYLNEQEFAIQAKLDKKYFKSNQELNKTDEYFLKISLGYTGRLKIRNFEATQYNFRIHTDQRSTIVDPDNISAFFNQENLDKGNYYRIETFRGSHQVPFALDPQVYGGNQIIQGLYVNAEYKVSPKFIAFIGLRGEYIYQAVTWNTQLDPSDKMDILGTFELLPSLVTKYEINRRQNLRFGASKTYTLPQFKERALFIYEDVTQVKIGNPDLYQSTNYNLDLKWEFFPNVGEIISVGTFGKYILNPINEVTISSATNDISFLNTGDWGYVAGVEIEARKDLINNYETKLIAGFNIAYMHTDQELNSEKIANETNYAVRFTKDRAKFTGASDLLIGTDITYIKIWNHNKNRFMTTISYSYFSDRVYAIGTNQRGDMIDKAFSSLDLVLKTELRNLGFGINVKNLLDPTIETYQANSDRDIIVLSYKKGINLSLSLSFKF